MGEWSLTWELCCGGVVTDLGVVLWGSGHLGVVLWGSGH